MPHVFRILHPLLREQPLVDHIHGSFAGCAGGERRDQPLRHGVGINQGKVRLVREVERDGARRHLGLGGDVGDRGGLVPVLSKQPRRRALDRCPPSCL